MTTIKLRRSTASEWSASNPVLSDGEPGFERDSGKVKIGDGVKAWNQLPYFISELLVNPLVNASVATAVSNTQNLRAKATGKRLRAQLTGRQRRVPNVTLGALTLVATNTVGDLETKITGCTTDSTGTTKIVTPVPHGLALGDLVRFIDRVGTVYFNGDTFMTYTVSEVTDATHFKVFINGGTSGANQDTGPPSTQTFSVVKALQNEWGYDLTNAKLNPNFLFLDTRPVQYGPTAPRYRMAGPDLGIVTFGAGVQASTSITAHTLLTDNAFELMHYNSGSNVLQVYVDDVLIDTITPAQMTAASAPAGYSAFKTYTFPDTRARMITIRGVPTTGIRRRKSSLMTRPSQHLLDLGARVLFVGDSFTEGSGRVNGPGLVPDVQQLLGWRDVWQAGSGSTGYVSDGARVALEDRYQNDIIAQAPDICIIAMGINDLGLSWSTVVASAANIWDAVIAGLPDTQLIIVGPFPQSGGATPQGQNVLDLDNGLKDAATTRGLQYISPVALGWTFTRFDATHPDDAGYKKLATYLAGHLAIPTVPA